MASLIIHGVVGIAASLRHSIHRTIDIWCSRDGGRSFQYALSSLQSFTQCNVLFGGTCSSSEMHQPEPPVSLQKCISRGHNERSAWCCQQDLSVRKEQCIVHERKLGWCFTVEKKRLEKLWREFFSDPSQWSDNREAKVNPRYPDFKHKQTQESLWLESRLNPPWVRAKVAAMAPGTLQVDHFTWNKRLSNYVKARQHEKTMELFQQMQLEGLNPDKFTFVPVLNACAGLRDLEEGRRIHSQVIQTGHESNVYVGNCLIDMYAKCGSIEDAQRVFGKMPLRDVVSWNTMIVAYVKFGLAQGALELFSQMEQEKVDPDPLTFVGLLNACASLGALEEGKHVHYQIVKRGYESDVFIGNSLVDMYAKCGCMEDAWRVFNKMATRDQVGWTAIILGHVRCGEGQRALELSRQMQQENVEPNPVTFVGMLNACASVAALDEGRCIHDQIKQSTCNSDVFVCSSLINMYAKCGSIEDASGVFDSMPTCNAVAWNAMLMGYAVHGHVMEALIHFELMLQTGVEMDEVTFVSLLSACSHGGLVDEGLHYFESMIAALKICPTMEHYSCVTDLLGRAGHVHEAEDLIKTMTLEPNAAVWKSLLGACRLHGNVDMAECVAERVVKSDPANASGYVMLSNIYSAAGKWESGKNIRHQRLGRGLKTQPL